MAHPDDSSTGLGALKRGLIPFNSRVSDNSIPRFGEGGEISALAKVLKMAGRNRSISGVNGPLQVAIRPDSRVITDQSLANHLVKNFDRLSTTPEDGPVIPGAGLMSKKSFMKDPLGELGGGFEELAPRFEKWMASQGVAYDPKKGEYHFSPSGARVVAKEMGRIGSDYDGKTNFGTWDKYDLGGDDDVDYNSGIPYTTIQALQDYTDTNPIPTLGRPKPLP